MDSYITKKILHLKRIGIGGGQGLNGGACPDWLVTHQKEEKKRMEQSHKGRSKFSSE